MRSPRASHGLRPKGHRGTSPSPRLGRSRYRSRASSPRGCLRLKQSRRGELTFGSGSGTSSKLRTRASGRKRSKRRPKADSSSPQCQRAPQSGGPAATPDRSTASSGTRSTAGRRRACCLVPSTPPTVGSARPECMGPRSGPSRRSSSGWAPSASRRSIPSHTQTRGVRTGRFTTPGTCTRLHRVVQRSAPRMTPVSSSCGACRVAPTGAPHSALAIPNTPTTMVIPTCTRSNSGTTTWLRPRSWTGRRSHPCCVLSTSPRLRSMQ
mmetsp:Transcript_1268/g.3524  ORF Transcript_1268/g.3524 Transcript_1268/m.3524 type:complete len:266 (-) Transcript_1268:197-994(-)